MEKEIRNFSLTEIRAIDGAAPVIEGHAAVFNQKSHDMGFREIIMPGAFANAIQTDDVKFLLNHRGLPIARTKSGTLRLSEDQRGLAFRAELDPSDPDVQRLLPKVRRGDLNEMSCGFGVADRADEKWTRDNGEMVRSLFKVSLFDVSAVSFPAYPQTDLNMRSFYEAQMKALEETGEAPPEQAPEPEIIVPRIAGPDPLSYEGILSHARMATPISPPESDEEKIKREIEERKASRMRFVEARLPKPDPFSYAEILRKTRVST